MDARLLCVLARLTALLIASAVSAGCTSTSRQRPVLGPESDRAWIALCPDGEKFCAWSADLRTVPLEGFDASRVFDYAIGDAGEFIALLCGHQASGELIVVDGAARFILHRILSPNTICGELSSLFGQTPNGDIVLCTADHRCDVRLNAPPIREAYPELTERCDAPRFSSDGGIACLADGSIAGWQCSVDADDISDFQLSTRSRAVALRSDGVYELDGTGAMRRLPGGSPLWMSKVADRIYYATCQFDDTTPTTCELYKVERGDEATLMWSSPTLVPRYLQRSSRASVVLDAWGSGRRELLSIDRDQTNLVGRL
jgi:hypothetical protein